MATSQNSSATAPAAYATGGLRNPWVQLIAGIVCMAMVANLQYGWTVFVNPIAKNMGWTKAAIQVSFTIFVLVETWLVPLETILVDRFGPRVVVMAGGVFTALAWIVDSWAHSLGVLYLGGALAGIGAGMVYGTCIANALKWFGQRRGLAAGLTSAGFGAGAAITVIPLVHMIATSGYRATFFAFGIGQGVVILIAALFLITPPKQAVSLVTNPNVLQGRKPYTPQETLQSPVFWVMYVMFVLVAAGGLMAVAQLAPIATAYGIAKTPVSIFGITAAALPFALSLNNVMNGLTRPILGGLSDRFGRETVMFWAFLIEGIGIFAFAVWGHSPLAFVVLAAVVFFAWGEIYSIFPSTTRDHFGQPYAATNYGMLYTAKGTASFIVPLSSWITAVTHSWEAALFIAGAFNIVAGIMALAALRPIRVADIRRHQPATYEQPVTGAPVGTAASRPV